MKYYIVRLARGGCYRIKAESADEARQRVTYDYRERVKSVTLDDDQNQHPTEDW